MANNDDSVIISVSADMSNFNKGVREAIQGTEKIIDKGKELEEKMSGTGASLNSVGASAENLADKMAEAAEKVEEIAQHIGEAGSSASEVSENLQGLSSSFEETAKSSGALQEGSRSAASSLGECAEGGGSLETLLSGLVKTLLEVSDAMKEMTAVLKENKMQTEENSKATDELNKTAKESLNIQKFTSVYMMAAKAAMNFAKQVVSVSKELAKIYSVQEQAETRLTAINKTMGKSVGYTTAELREMASAMQANSTFGDEIVMGAQKTLLALGTLNKEGFEKALQASADLAAAMGTDIDSAAQTLSYSLLDPENGLRRLKTAGIAFTEAEKEQIKTLVEAGNEQEAQLLILNKVEESYNLTSVVLLKT